MNEIIGSLLMFALLTSLVMGIFFAARQYLEQWREEAVVESEIQLLHTIDEAIDSLKEEGESSSRVFYARIREPMTGNGVLSFSHPFEISRVYRRGNVLSGRFLPMNCTTKGNIFTMGNGIVEADFSVVDGSFNISDTLLSIRRNGNAASIHGIYIEAGSMISGVEGKSIVFSSPYLCSITYDISSPKNFTIKYSLSPVSDYVKMEVEWK